jgi:sulfur relay (sulfurtransferase) complex TusBCD TusD component (DsrE family)
MSPIVERRTWDVLVILTAPPHTTDTLTTVLRLAQAVLDQEHTIRVWACGYNTMLTQSSLGDVKPADLRDPTKSAPTAAALIRGLLTAYKGRFSWIVCTACSADRGARDHIAAVRLRSDARLAATIAAAHRTVYIGGA